MRADKEEWIDLQRQSNKEPGHTQNNDRLYKDISGMLRQASVKAERLTESQSWDYFLTLLSSWIDRTKAQADQFRKALESPDLVNLEQKRLAENYLMICNERITVLEAVSDLPNQIMNGDKDVNLSLHEMQPKNNN